MSEAPTDDLLRLSIGCMALPAFHTLGVICTLLYSMWGMSIIALYPPTATTPTSLPPLPTAENIVDHLRRTKCETLITIPTLLQTWAQNKKHVDFLANLKLVVRTYPFRHRDSLSFASLNHYLLLGLVGWFRTYEARKFHDQQWCKLDSDLWRN